MGKVFAYIFGGLIVFVMFFAPVREYMNNLFHRDKKEMREEDIIGRTSGHNPRIEEIQNILKEGGYDPGSVDGVMGAQTRTAIKGFQKAKGLKATGKIDPETQLALNKTHEPEKLSANQTAKAVSWEGLSSDDRAKQIQTALKKAGFYQGKIDGKIGPRTKAAISDFQRSIKLNPDGVVGQKTWEALGKYLQNE
jgi:peptidoglycan hydrolase-like protein with peptidoglycan-binding domain